MISNYRIKDNVLYLYMDYNYELGLIDIKNSINKIKDDIKQYIKDKKIMYTGTTIAIVVGGIVIGNIVLNNNSKDMPNIDNSILCEYITKDSLEDALNIEISEEKSSIEETIDDGIINKEENTNDEKIEVENNNKRIEEKNIQVNNNTEIITNEVTPEEVKVEISNVVEKVDSIYVNIYRSNGNVVKLELEEYLVGCVGAEMPAAFNEEALKSQAVIARTYALKSIKTDKRLTDTESTQSYKSNDELKNTWGSSYNTYYNKIKSAVDSTRGEYLSYNGDYIEAVYHSTSNGMTESSTNVWGNYFPYLVSVSSEYDSDSPTYIQDKFITYDEISNKLGITINIETNFNIISKTSGNRVEYIDVGGTTFRGVDFRNKLGLRSSDFDMNKSDNGITFTTRGYGHGVGLSQYGANGMAKSGHNYKDILIHYYPGTVLKNIY